VSDDQSGSGEGKKAMPGTRRKARRGKDAVPDAAFDLWLDRELNKMFGKLAEEPIPPELLALIEKSRKGS
jgi:hypothetical protein